MIPKKEVEAIVSLSPRAGVVAGALSAVLYEKKEAQITSIIMTTTSEAVPLLPDERLKPKLRVMLLEEVVKETDMFVQAVNRIRHHGSEIVAGIALIDLLDPSERKCILNVLPNYKFVLAAEDIIGVRKA